MSYLFLRSTTNSREEQSMSTKKQSRGRGGGKEEQQRKERGNTYMNRWQRCRAESWECISAGGGRRGSRGDPREEVEQRKTATICRR